MEKDKEVKKPVSKASIEAAKDAREKIIAEKKIVKK